MSTVEDGCLNFAGRSCYLHDAACFLVILPPSLIRLALDDTRTEDESLEALLRLPNES